MTLTVELQSVFRTRMDVMRIDSDDNERRFCVCVASYGYMGDLMRQSEKLRFLGPSRYNLAGAATLFKNRVCAPTLYLLYMQLSLDKRPD